MGVNYCENEECGVVDDAGFLTQCSDCVQKDYEEVMRHNAANEKAMEGKPPRRPRRSGRPETSTA